MGRLFLSSSYRPRARESGASTSLSRGEGKWDVFFSHHPIDLGPGRESGASISHIILRPRAREGEWDVFFSHHPIDLGPGRESGASISLIILRPRAREGEWDDHPKT